VTSVIRAGTGLPGSTSDSNSATIRPPRTRTAPISVMPASSGAQPVVSTSTTVKSRSASLVSQRARSRVSVMITTVERATDISVQARFRVRSRAASAAIGTSITR
jgi:hypothetical protein